MAITDNFVSEFLPLVTDLAAGDGADYKKALFKKAFEPSDVRNSHTLVTGVRNGNLIPIVTGEADYSSFPFVDANTCDATECDLDTGYSGEKWELALQECRIPICLRSFNDDFNVFWNNYKMINPSEEATNEYLRSALLQFLTDKFKLNFTAGKWRGMYFGDKSLTANALFNGQNGYFTRAEAETDQVVEIAKNNVTTSYADQRMTGEEIYETIKEAYELYLEQDWAETGAFEIRVTKRIAIDFANYLNGLKDLACCDGVERLNPDSISSRSFSKDNLSFRGLPIVAYEEWDKIINTVAPLNGGGGTAARINPNRILITRKENLLIGTQNSDELDMFDIWYDRTDKKVYLEAGAYYGVGMPANEQILAI